MNELIEQTTEEAIGRLYTSAMVERRVSRDPGHVREHMILKSRVIFVILSYVKGSRDIKLYL